MRQHTLAYVSIRQHTSVYVSMRQHTSAYVSICQHASTCVSMRQHTSAYGIIRTHTLAYVSMRQHASAYVIIRTHTYAYVSIRQHTSAASASHSISRPPLLLLHVLFQNRTVSERPRGWRGRKRRAERLRVCGAGAYVSIRQHTSAYVERGGQSACKCVVQEAQASVFVLLY
jgi:hypothetical protein